MDATALGSGRGGDETYLRGMLEGLAIVAAPDDAFPLFLRAGAHVPDRLAHDERFPVTHLPAAPAVRRLLLDLPVALRRAARRGQLFHALTHVPVAVPVPVALTVADLSYLHHPELFPRATRLRLRLLVGAQIRRVAAVLTPSDFSRDDICATYGIDPSRVHVVPNTVEPLRPLPDSAREAFARWRIDRGIRDRYVLSLGNLHPRKNVPRLIRAMAEVRRVVDADVQLVVAGNRWWGRGEEEAAAATAPPGSIVFVGAVDDATRDLLLRQSAAFAYPSLFEGFGIPPLEAMAQGTPVVASDRASLPSVLGDAAVLVDPYDVDAIGSALVAVLEDDSLRERLIDAGHGRVERYTLERAGAAAHAAFTAILATRGAA